MWYRLGNALSNSLAGLARTPITRAAPGKALLAPPEVGTAGASLFSPLQLLRRWSGCYSKIIKRNRVPFVDFETGFPKAQPPPQTVVGAFTLAKQQKLERLLEATPQKTFRGRVIPKLSVWKVKHSGRNNLGRICTRHRGGGTRQRLRFVDFNGAWQVLSDNFGKMFSSQSDLTVMGNEAKPDDPSEFWELSQIPNKKGRKCDGPNCENVHGERLEPKEGIRKGKKISLQECSGCFETMYCSEECQADAWPDHKDMCKEIQRERKEKDDQKKAQETLDREAKLEAARASFVPTNLIPQQGGGGKKKKRQEEWWR